MSLAIKARIEGLEPLIFRLNLLKQGPRNVILRRAVDRGNKILLKAARGNLKAYGFTTKSLLYKSLGSKIAVTRKGIVVGIVGPRTGFKSVKGLRGIQEMTPLGRSFAAAGVDPTRYAHLVEKGRRGLVPTNKKIMVYPGAGGNLIWARSVRPVAARPFLRPALDQNKGQVVAAMSEEIGRGFERLAAKGA